MDLGTEHANNGTISRKIVDLEKPLLTLEDLAILLDRTPKGLSDTVHGHTDLGQSLRRIRVRLGRRVYFRRDMLDQIISQATGR